MTGIPVAPCYYNINITINVQSSVQKVAGQKAIGLYYKEGEAQFSVSYMVF